MDPLYKCEQNATNELDISRKNLQNLVFAAAFCFFPLINVSEGC